MMDNKKEEPKKIEPKKINKIDVFTACAIFKLNQGKSFSARTLFKGMEKSEKDWENEFKRSRIIPK